MDIGGQIYRYRKKQKGLTQEKLAEQLDVTFQAISSWERNEYKPDVDHLIALAEKLHTTPSHLLSPCDTEALPEKDRFSDEERMYTFLASACRGMPLVRQTLPFIREKYAARTLPGTDVPFRNLPLTLACHCFSLELGEEAIAAALLSYTGLTAGAEAFPDLCPASVKNSVRLFTAYKQGVYNKEALQSDTLACLLVLTDAVHLPTAGRYTAGETAASALRAQREALPLAAVLKRGTPALNNAAWTLSHTLMEQIELIRRFL